MAQQSVMIAGYASLFNQADLSGDRVQKGAFKRSLNVLGAKNIRLLWQHNPAEPVGVWHHIHEDRRGLYAVGELLLSTQRGFELAQLIKAGAIDGLSIGFKTLRAKKPNQSIAKAKRDLLDLDLWEISLVTFPMLPQARLKILPASSTLAA